MLKIKINKFVEILTLFSLNKNIKQFNIKFKENEVIISGLTEDNIAYGRLILKPNFFEEYENLGIFPIYDINDFIKILLRFDKVVTIQKNNNLFIVKEINKYLISNLPDEIFIKDVDTEIYDSLIYENHIEIDSEFFKDFFDINDADKNSIIKLMVDKDKFVIKSKNNHIYVKELNINYSGNKKEVIVNNLVSIVNNIKGVFKLYIENNMPLQIVKEDIEYNLKLIICPIEGESNV